MAEKWRYVTVEWYYNNPKAFTITDAANYAASKGADIVRLRADIHPTMRTRTVDGELYYPDDPDGEHYTMEMRMKHGHWNTYHMYIEKQYNPTTGREEYRRRRNMQVNPKNFGGVKSNVAKNNREMAGSDRIKAYY